MPRVTLGVALGGLWVGAWALVLATLGGDPLAFVGCLAVLLAPGLIGGPVGALLDARRLAEIPRGAALGFVLVIGLTWPVGFWAFRFLLTHSFDLLDEVAAVFATVVVGAVVVSVLGAGLLARALPRPAGQLGALPPLALAALGVVLVSRVTSRIVGFELITLAMAAGSATLAVPALRLLLPARWTERRGAMVTVAGLAVLALGGSLAAYTASSAVRSATWSTIPVAQRLAAALAQVTDADADGVSGLLGHPDCNDLDPNVFPGAHELVGNGRDDNCWGGDGDPDAAAALWSPGGARHPGPPGAAGFPRKRYNVVLITLDAVRADHLGVYGYERPTSPNLDNLARLSLTFDAAWSASNFTALSLYSLFTGVYPSGYLEGESIISRAGVTLGEWLERAGYRTEAIVDLTERLQHVFIGFDAVDQTLGIRAAQAVRNRSTGSTAAELTQLSTAALARLGEGEAPFFLWVHYSEPHAEYLPHPEASFGDTAIDRYDGEIAFADAAVGDLLVALRDGGRLKDTVIVVTADHGEAFGEHGVSTHGQSLYEEELHVPLLVYLPAASGAGFRARRLASPVDLTDLAPTIMDAVGLRPPAPTHGESLLPYALDDQALLTPEAFAETRLPYARLQALRRGDEKIIVDHLVGAARRFDLASDPGESDGTLVAPDTIAPWADLHLAFPRLSTGGMPRRVQESELSPSAPR